MVIPWYFLKVFPYKKVLWQYHDAIMVSNGNTTVILKYTIGLKFIYYGILKTLFKKKKCFLNILLLYYHSFLDMYHGNFAEFIDLPWNIM